jgi:hypothetical protein
MNAAFDLLPVSDYAPIQSLNAPKNKTLQSTPIYGILPSFSVRSSQKTEGFDVDFPDELEVAPAQSLESKWNAHLNIKLKSWIKQDGKQVGREDTRSIRLSLQSDFDRPFPQSHKIVLMDPIDDIFFHCISWIFDCLGTLNLNPFTYQSFAKQMKWKADYKETFRGFALLIQKCANNVIHHPLQYFIKNNASDILHPFKLMKAKTLLLWFLQK